MDARKSRFVDARAQFTEARASKARPTLSRRSRTDRRARASPSSRFTSSANSNDSRPRARSQIARRVLLNEDASKGFAAPQSFATWRPTTRQQWRPARSSPFLQARTMSSMALSTASASGSSTRSASSAWYANEPRSASTINKPGRGTLLSRARAQVSVRGAPTRKGTGASKSAWSCVGSTGARAPTTKTGRASAVRPWTQAAAASGAAATTTTWSSQSTAASARSAVRAGSLRNSSGTLVAAAAAMAP